MYKWFIVLVLFIGLSFRAHAQYDGLGGWNVITINLPGSTDHHWGGYLEAQNRNYGVASKFYYYEFKTGVSYTLDKNNTALLGTGRYVTYNYEDIDDGPSITETRLWEQFVSNQYLGRIKFEHRYRVEQRWLNTGYRNRFRYRLSANIPINKPKVEPGTLFGILYDEVFFNNKAPNFERNRVAALLGFQFSKPFGIQTGILNQFNNTATSTNRKYYFLVNAIYNIQRKSSK